MCYVDLSAIDAASLLTLNGSIVLRFFEYDNTVEICTRIMFDFYPGLPHM